jgi:hypothetical protein
MVRSFMLRMSAALAVALTAGAVLVATGSAATANNGDPVIAGQLTTSGGAATVVHNTSGIATCTGYGPPDGLVGCGGTGVVADGAGIGVYAVGQTFGVDSYGSTAGVYGYGGTAGVIAESTQVGHKGVGLKVNGRSVFQTAGTAVVVAGSTSVTVHLPGIATKDFVLATVQGSDPFYVRNASAASSQFTITINKASATNVTVAYFVISAS